MYQFDSSSASAKLDTVTTWLHAVLAGGVMPTGKFLNAQPLSHDINFKIKLN